MLGRRAALAGSAMLVAARAQAAGYPDHPIRMVVPFAPGGAADVVSRLACGELATVLGQQVFIDNRGGAGGTIGSEIAIKAAPDGYTLVMHTVSSAVLDKFLYKNLNYAVDSFTPIAQIGAAPTLLVINAKLPAKTLAEFIAMVKASPGKYRYGSSGVGAIMHLAGELFCTLAGVKMIHVPYRGEGPAMKDLLAGETQMEVGIAGAVLPFIRSGQLRPLCVNAETRLDLFPDVPTAAEAGLSGFETFNWYGLFGPPGLPPPVIQRVSDAMAEALTHPDLITRLKDAGVTPVPAGPAQFAEYWHAQLTFWGPIIERSGTKL